MTIPIGASIAAFAAGAAFGAAYMAVLWLSVSALSPRGGIGSFVVLGLVRGIMVVGALVTVFTLTENPVVILAALLGFVISRIAVTRILRSRGQGSQEWK